MTGLILCLSLASSADCWPAIEPPPVFSFIGGAAVHPGPGEPGPKPAAVDPPRLVPRVALWDFSSPNCPPCRALQPILERLRKRGRTIYETDNTLLANWITAGILKEETAREGDQLREPTPYLVMWISDKPWQTRIGFQSEQQLEAWFQEAEQAASK